MEKRIAIMSDLTKMCNSACGCDATSALHGSGYHIAEESPQEQGDQLQSTFSLQIERASGGD